MLKRDFSYRNFTIRDETGMFVADQEVDDDDDVVCEIACSRLEGLLSAIDQIHAALDGPFDLVLRKTPAWFNTWLEGGAETRIILDDDPDQLASLIERLMLEGTKISYTPDANLRPGDKQVMFEVKIERSDGSSDSFFISIKRGDGQALRQETYQVLDYLSNHATA